MSGAIPFSEYVTRFKQVRPSLPNELSRELDAAAPWLLSIVRASTSVAKPASPRGGYGAVATGKLLNSWKATRVGSKGILISNSTTQALIADVGRKKGAKMPPLENIAKWAQARLGLSASEARSAAWPIARAIKQRGLQKRGILHSDQSNRQLVRFMEMRFTKTVALTFRKAFGK
jgi:hypothetical protein